MTIQWVKCYLELSVKHRGSPEEQRTNLSGMHIQEQNFWTSGHRHVGIWAEGVRKNLELDLVFSTGIRGEA